MDQAGRSSTSSSGSREEESEPHPAAGHALNWILTLPLGDLAFWRHVFSKLAEDDPEILPNDSAVAALAALDAIEKGVREPTPTEILGLAWIIITKGEGTLF